MKRARVASLTSDGTLVSGPKFGPPFPMLSATIGGFPSLLSGTYVQCRSPGSPRLVWTL